MKLFETEHVKAFRSKELNYNFDKRNGYTSTWGKTEEDDPTFSKYGPMILDIEITDICKGPGGKPCPFCLPGNFFINTTKGKKFIKKLKKGDIVLGFDVKNKIVRKNKIKETFKRKYNGDLICIELDNGKTIKLTPEHPVILKDGSEILAKDLTNRSDIIYIKDEEMYSL